MSWQSLKKLLLNQNHSGEFIGMGNPDAKILIIGKECAINPNNRPRSNAEITLNWDEWNNIINGKSGNVVFFDKTAGYNCNIKHNPRTGQQYYDKHSKAYLDLIKSPARTLSNGSHGLGGTWYYYSKILECLLKVNYKKGCDFFDDCFMTELSAIPALTSDKVAECDRIKSIRNRTSKDGILHEDFFKGFDEDFFKGFEIVIVAASTYIKKYNLIGNLKALFPNSKVIITCQVTAPNKPKDLPTRIKSAIPKINIGHGIEIKKNIDIILW